MKYIDMKTWPRRESFDFFSTFENPLFNVCAQPEITLTYKFLEQYGISKFNAMLWLLTHAANAVPEIRYRIREDKIIEHKRVNPSFTVLTDDKTLAFCPVKYTIDLGLFFDDIEQGIAQIKKNPTMDDEPGVDNLLFISCLPWINFTSISHPRKNDITDFIPRISWGKFTHTNEKTVMPVSIQLHHGLADGYHAGLFFNKLESMLSQPEIIFKCLIG